MAQGPVGAHLCGSVPFDSAQQVFEQIGEKLGSRITSITDGETDNGRHWWIFSQSSFFQNENFDLRNPWLAAWLAASAGVELKGDVEPKKLEPHEYEEALKDLKPGFDVWALQSYELFKAAKAAGHVPQHVKFQVTLPTPLGVVTAFVSQIHGAPVEKIYARKMKECVDRIQRSIPHNELVIQWDYAMEPAMLDGVYDYFQFKDFFTPHFKENIKGELTSRLSEMIEWVARDVPVGFHLCYGDLMHMHFKEPEDTMLLAEIIEMLQKASSRHVDWVHIPVPKSRSDADYLKPLVQKNVLKPMSDNKTKLWMGLVHANDEAGTRARIATTEEVLKGFPDLQWGISTECGWGRTPRPEVESIIEILNELSAPVA